VTTIVVPVTTTAAPVTTTVAPVVKYDDVCTDGGAAPKTDSTGKVMRCTQFTVNGQSCANECAKSSKSYYWCMTNVNALKAADWWDYCSPWGYTTNNAKCTDRCGKHGEDYYWCHTDKNDKSKWDKCSPQGRLKPVQYTYKKSLCISECQKWGEKYFWCKKNMDYCTGGGRGESCDDAWDYCSPDPMHTRYNKKCKKRCNNNGKDYYWCYEEDGNWDYCSPAPKMGVDVKDYVEVTIHGVKCSNACKRSSSGYYWCKQYGQKDTWDYCSLSPKRTIYNKNCKDRCSRRDEDYFWCNTDDSWDYCSPKAGKIPRQAEAQTTSIFVWIFAVPMGIVCCLAMCWLFKRIC